MSEGITKELMKNNKVTLIFFIALFASSSLGADVVLLIFCAIEADFPFSLTQISFVVVSRSQLLIFSCSCN